MILDPRTVVILTVLSTFLMSISLFAVSRGYLAEMRGIKRWATGTLLQSLGWIFLALLGVVPSIISELGSPLIMLAMALYFHALTAFKESTVSVKWVYIVVVLNFFAIYFFLLWVPDMSARIVVASSTAALLMFASARLLLSDRLSKLPVSHIMTGGLFLTCSIVLIVRAIYYLVWNNAPDQTGLEQNVVQGIAFLTFFIAAVISPFTFILMCNDRYNANALLRTQELADKNEQLEEASKAKGQFLATMSHELRTPLNGVVGFLRQLEKTRLDEQQRDFLKTINLSARMLLNVINDVLDYSKIEAGKMSIEIVEIHPREFFDNTISMFAANAEVKGLDLVCVIDQRIYNPILGDPLRLAQVLSNLLGNAIKFTEQGEVLLEVKLINETETSVALQIVITDSGIGISQQSLAGLFQPFVQADASTTRNHGGTGLGLIIARQLLEIMGGSISVESEIGRGTCFSINLELQKQLPTLNTTTLPDLSQVKALVVTGNSNLARSIAENLSLLGVDTQAASSGLSALALINDAADNEFNAIIVDHMLNDVTPDEFSASIRLATGVKAPSLLLIGNLEYCAMYAAMKNTAYGCCLNKPPKGAELYQELIALFASNHQASELTVSYAKKIPQQTTLLGKRVLIVDDNNINRKLVQLLVQELHGEFDLAENGLQAVDACSRRAYDVILMDINMPVMDGLEATSRIRALETSSRRTPIFALTANALPGDKEKFIACGMDDYLSKPINENALLDVLSRWCITDTELLPLTQPLTVYPQDFTMPALDPALGIKLCFGEPDTWHMVLGLMLDELENYAEKLDEFSDNNQQLIYWSHKLAGSSCYCGTPALHQAAKQLEISCTNNEPAPAILKSREVLLQQIKRMLMLDAAGKLRRTDNVVI